MKRWEKASGKKSYRSSKGEGPSSASKTRNAGTQANNQTGPGAGPESTRGATKSKPSDGRGGSRWAGRSTEPGLYLVATPIGNAEDITLRALRVLKDAHVIACEDSRVTGKLLSMHGISTRLAPYHEHNAPKARPALIKRIKRGETVALVSDAGTPLVSDPGYKLVRACIDEGLMVTALPGPSSVLAGLSLAGLPTDRFLFQGFLPPRTAGRKKTLALLATVPATLVFMESARRLPASLDDMARVLGPRQAAVAREMTKMFEEVRRGPLPELAAHYRRAGPPKGEVVVVVQPPLAVEMDDAGLDRRITEALKTLSIRDAAGRVAMETGAPRRRVYNRALELKKKAP